MKILMVISQFFPLIGGAEKQAQLLAKTIQNKGVEVNVVTGWWKFGTPQAEMMDGINVFRNFSCWGMFGIRGIRPLGAVIYIFNLAIYLLIHKREYDIIHVHQALYPAFVSVLIGKKILRKPVIVKTASSGITSDIKQLKKYPFGNIQLRYLIKEVEYLVSNSKVGGDEFKEIGFPESKIVFIPNGVDIPKEKKISFSEVKLVMVAARLSLEKGIDVLLRAWVEVASMYPGLKLIIAGQGPLESSLKKLCQDLELTDSVEFVGLIPNLNELFSYTDLFVLPSRTEGLSNALLEAMSYGLPCITTNVGGNIELIGDDGRKKIVQGGFLIAKNGLLVNSDDVEGLSQAMLFLIRNGIKREELGNQARSSIQEHYSIDLIADQYIGLYQHMLNRKL
ncbi:MAG: glycosyltransferase family 4 protein [Syntrophaceae bacterium]|nr:glycosyltransferase family 4 protein [Syntrophaceae bacterium]